MEEKAMRIGAAIIAAFLMLILGGMITISALLIMDCHDVMRTGQIAEKYEVLDRESYKYDADDAFLYIDTAEGVGAVYIGTIPVGHFELENGAVLRQKERTFDTPTLIERKED